MVERLLQRSANYLSVDCGTESTRVSLGNEDDEPDQN